jgi:VWFA-related protein
MTFFPARAPSVPLGTVALGAVLSLSPLSAQQPEGEIPAPTIRVNTRLVLVDVVVTDKKGQAIKDLKPEDFVLEESGKKQKIAAFSAPAEGSKSPALPTLPPGIYSNEPEFRAPGGPITVFVLDAANTPFRDQAYGRLQMLKYVAEQNKSAQRTAIFALTDRLQVVQDFTSDPQLLAQALKRYKPQEPVLSGGGPPAISAAGADSFSIGSKTSAISLNLVAAQDILSEFQSIQISYAMDRRTETTLAAMRSLARVLGGMPGRKEVIWLTAAFPFDLIPEDRNISEAELQYLQSGVGQRTLSDIANGSIAQTERRSYLEEIRITAAQMSSAQIALYPVDVRGLGSGTEVNFSDLPSRQSLDFSGRAIVRMSDAASDQEAMRAIATETGGKVYVNQNEIKDGIAIALADNDASYTLGYYPEDKKWSGKFRTIKVKVSREGAQVRHRKGYFALDPAQAKQPRPDQELAEALRSNVPATLVAFKAQVKPGDKGKVRVVFLVDARTLTAEDVSGGKKLNVTFYAAPVGADGKIGSTRTTKVDQAFKPDIYEQIVQKGMMTPLDVDLPPNAREVRLAVRDERTGNVGTIDAPLAQ